MNTPKTEESIAINKVIYDKLLADGRLLRILFANGVDSWSGFNEAIEIYKKIVDYEK